MIALQGMKVFPQSDHKTDHEELKHLSLQKGRSAFIISGNYRLRGELQHDYNIKTYGTEDDEIFLLSRLRFCMEYRYSSWLKVFAEIQDARIFGSSFSDEDFQGKNNPYHDPFDINKLYVSLRPFDSLELIIGRQSLGLAGRRVFGPGDWGNTGRYIWDVANLIYSNPYFKTQVLFGYNILHEPDKFPNLDKEGTYALAFYNTIRKLPFHLELFYVYKYDQTGHYSSETGQAGNLYENYLGGRIKKSFGNWNILGLGAYQFGSISGDPVSAFGTVFQVDYTLNTIWHPCFIATYIFGSGDHDPDDGKQQTFDGIFSGSDTDLYSWMNFAFWKNIHLIQAAMVLKISPKISVRSEYHAYFLNQEKDAWYFPGKAMRRDTAGLSGSFVGQEVDLTCQANIFNWFQVLGGYCFFLPGEFAKNTGEHPEAQWAFAQLTFNF